MSEKKILKYLDFINENTVEPKVKPKRKTKVKPPSPFKRPSVKPKPKATIDEVINKFQSELTEEDKKELIGKYES